MSEREEKGLSVWEAALALVSGIIGGGIVGVPFSLIRTGIPVGLGITLIIICLQLFSGHLYLKAMKLSPTYVESIYELGYVSMGSCSIFFIATLQVISCLGAMILYFVVFGDICASLIKQGFYPDEENALTKRYLYILVLAIALIPIVIQKMLSEIKIVSILLFVTVTLFIALFLVQLIIEGDERNKDPDYSEYF